MSMLQCRGHLHADPGNALGVPPGRVGRGGEVGLAGQCHQGGRGAGEAIPNRAGVLADGIWGRVVVRGGRESAGHERPGHAGRGQSARHGAQVPIRCRSILRCPNAPDLLQDDVQAQPLDELHDVVVHPLVLTDAEDGYDVRVMQPCSGLRLAVEAEQVFGVE
jgi:hypothetical protein